MTSLPLALEAPKSDQVHCHWLHPANNPSYSGTPSGTGGGWSRRSGVPTDVGLPCWHAARAYTAVDCAVQGRPHDRSQGDGEL
jgi:hypothetical protein